MTNPRVKVSSQPIVTQSSLYTIERCPFSVPPGSPMPCATGHWIAAATRAQARGERVLLQDSQAVCTPNGTPLSAVVTQARVKAL